MIFIECVKLDESRRNILGKMEKEFVDPTEFSYFYKCAKMDQWDLITVRAYDPKQDGLLSATRDLLLVRARKV